VWAIGTGVNATPEDAAAMHRMIQEWLRSRLGAEAPNFVLYGGSVTPENAPLLLAQPEIGGVLVGGASLTAESWVRVVESASR
jgi:triosephosphate isomerase